MANGTSGLILTKGGERIRSCGPVLAEMALPLGVRPRSFLATLDASRRIFLPSPGNAPPSESVLDCKITICAEVPAGIVNEPENCERALIDRESSKKYRLEKKTFVIGREFAPSCEASMKNRPRQSSSAPIPHAVYLIRIKLSFDATKFVLDDRVITT